MISMHLRINSLCFCISVFIQDAGCLFLYQSRVQYCKMIQSEEWAYQGNVVIKQASYVVHIVGRDPLLSGQLQDGRLPEVSAEVKGQPDTLTLQEYSREFLIFFSNDSFHYQWWLFLLELEKLGNKFEERLHILIFLLKRMTFLHVIIVHIISICQLQCLYLVFEFLKMCSVNHRASYPRVNALFFFNQFSVICNVTINGVDFKTIKKPPALWWSGNVI